MWVLGGPPVPVLGDVPAVVAGRGGALGGAARGDAHIPASGWVWRSADVHDAVQD